MMRRALIWLNPYGREAGQHKLKNRQKMHLGLNFYYYDGLQPEMSAGIINEHECNVQHFFP